MQGSDNLVYSITYARLSLNELTHSCLNWYCKSFFKYILFGSLLKKKNNTDVHDFWILRIFCINSIEELRSVKEVNDYSLSHKLCCVGATAHFI